MQEQKDNIFKVIVRRFFILCQMVFSGIKLLLLKPYWKDGIISIIIFFSFISNLFMWYFIYAKRIEGNYPVILHYNLIFGVDYLGSYNNLYLIPIVGLSVLVFGTILSYHIYAKEKLASYFLQFNALVIQIFLFFAVYLVIRANMG